MEPGGRPAPDDPAVVPGDAPGVGPSSATGRWRHGVGAPALVFLTSAAVLVLEILAGRLVAPYVGVSLDTYTGIIGTVLAGIAAGSWAGGWAADRRDPRLLLGPTLLGSGVAALCVPAVVAALGPGVAASGAGPPGIVTLALAAFVVPTALLSAVSPMVAKLRLESTAETGAVVGSLSAAGTAGALVGTFLTGFVFMARLSTRSTVLGLGAALVALGVAVWWGAHRRDRTTKVGTGAPVAGAIVVVVAATLGVAAPSRCGFETRYVCGTVERDPARLSGRVLVLDDLRHSYVDLDDPRHLEFRYVRLFAQAVDAASPHGALDALHLGGGGFTFPRWLAATRPGTASVVLELDAELVDVARRELGLRTGPERPGAEGAVSGEGGPERPGAEGAVSGESSPELRVRIGDARRTITEEPADGYDLVVGDAFGGRAVPWHLATVEMVAEVARVLRPGGVYVMNVIDAGPRDLVRAMLATLAVELPHTALVAPPAGAAGNFVLVASDGPFVLAPIAPADGVVVQGDALRAFVGGMRPLTDDLAPTDRLITRP